MSRYNSAQWCAACAPVTVDEPVDMPAQFWWSEHMLAALSTWHLGRVIYAYRTHPFHGPQPLSQKRVATWLDVTQAQLSRIETGPAPEIMTKLMRWAQILRIPAELLWFKLPSTSTLGEVNRNDFLRTATAVTATAAASPHGLLQLLNDTTPVDLPTRVGSAEIEQLRAASALFASWDARYGGGLVREVVATQLRVAVSYLRAGCAPKYRNDLSPPSGPLRIPQDSWPSTLACTATPPTCSRWQ
ncbi:helix-turn-helix domain-containing protein [Nocardia sp. NPDC057353]|uniref:helix-turn-helix domain-containing protein n=1 Tax=Nocardia sp. NPDC057353 TaxID=3346104 RepID=UPI0036341AF1